MKTLFDLKVLLKLYFCDKVAIKLFQRENISQIELLLIFALKKLSTKNEKIRKNVSLSIFIWDFPEKSKQI